MPGIKQDGSWSSHSEAWSHAESAAQSIQQAIMSSSTNPVRLRSDMETIAEKAASAATDLRRTMASALASDEAKANARENLENMRRNGFTGYMSINPRGK